MLSLFLPGRCLHCTRPTAARRERALAHYLCEQCIRVLDATEPPDPREITQELDSRLPPGLSIAHIGCGWDGDPTHQVRAIQQTIHGNVYADTSSARSILPGLIEWAVSEIGAERVLFGTDTPLYHAGMQRARIDQADLPEAAKQAILRDNARRLFGLTAEPAATG